MFNKIDYTTYLYQSMFPNAWFRVTMPKTRGFKNGQADTLLDILHYGKLNVVARMADESRTAAYKPNAVWPSVQKWYLAHADMTFDANIKVRIINKMAQYAQENGATHEAPELTTKQKVKLATLTIPAVLISAIAAWIVLAVKETVTFAIAPFFYSMVYPFINPQASFKDVAIEYAKYGFLRPVVRLINKCFPICTVYNIWSGILLGSLDIEKALTINNAYNAQIPSSLSGLEGEKSTPSTPVATTAKKTSENRKIEHNTGLVIFRGLHRMGSSCKNKPARGSSNSCTEVIASPILHHNSLSR